MRALTDDMSQMYYSSRLTSSSEAGVSFLYDLEEVGAAVQQIRHQAEASMIGTFGATPLARWLLTHLDTTTDATDRVERRFVYESALLEEPAAAERLAALAGTGEQQRLVEQVPLDTLFVDGRYCIVHWTRDDAPGPRGAMLNQPTMVGAFTAVAEQYWAMAVPVPGAAEGGARDDMATRDRAIVRLLAIGASDARIARLLGISPRTMDRRVRAISESLGATSRFQAGALAAARGWLED